MKQITLIAALLVAFTMTAQEIIFEEDFDGNGPGLDSWTTIDVDGSAPNTTGNNGSNTFSGLVGTEGWTTLDLITDVVPNFAGAAYDSGTISGNVMASNSWTEPAGAVDDWAITPAIDIMAGATGVNLKWVAFSIANDNFLEDYEVRVSTTGNAIADFDTVLLDAPNEPNPFNGNVPAEHVIDLEDYIGETVYIAFRNVSNDQWGMVVDNVVVDAATLSLNDLAAFGFDYQVSNGALRLSANEPIQNISIFNLLGQNILNQKLSGTNEVVSINAMTTGVYVAQATIAGKTQTFKIIKK